MVVIFVLLLIAAAVCFVAAALQARVRPNLIGLGLFFWVLVPLLSTLTRLVTRT